MILKEFLTATRQDFIYHLKKQILVRKGAKKVYTQIANEEKEDLKVLFNVAADGYIIAPPLVLFPYEAACSINNNITNTKELGSMPFRIWMDDKRKLLRVHYKCILSLDSKK